MRSDKAESYVVRPIADLTNFAGKLQKKFPKTLEALREKQNAARASGVHIG